MSVFDPQSVPVHSRARWFVRRKGVVDLERGFANKQQASEWIDGFGHKLDWRVGFTFRLRGDTCETEIVDGKGKLAKSA